VKWLIRLGGIATLHLCEAAVFGPYQPQSAAAVATFFTARRSKNEGLPLFLLWGLLRDATSIERPGVFLLSACAAWAVVTLASYIFRTTLPLLLAIHCLALTAARSTYILLVSLGGSSIPSPSILPYILRAIPAALLVFLLLERPQEEPVL